MEDRHWIEQLGTIGEEIGTYAFTMRQDSPGGIAAVEAMAEAEDLIAKSIARLDKALSATNLA